MSAKRDSGAWRPYPQPALDDQPDATETGRGVTADDAAASEKSASGAAEVPAMRVLIPAGTDTPASDDRAARTSASMLWAAWADALGFISELTDAAGLSRRLGGRPLESPVAWRRRVGGRFGVQAELPAGCYSDDTQLRLATGRSISGHGFDVEAFARVELTLWPTYALGGGHSSRAAASAMTKSRASWYANFYDGWHRGGGNGAAMRTQPHVWAAADLTGDRWLEDTLINGAVTHGHPRALVGAALANAALAFTFDKHRRPTLDDWPALLDVVASGDDILTGHSELGSIWRPSWEKVAGESFHRVWQATVDECRAITDKVAPLTVDLAEHADTDIAGIDAAWSRLLDMLGLYDDATRGSGTATVAAALVLSAAFNDPATAARCAARAVGSDTDTIATMAASILGAANPSVELPTAVQDEAYLRGEAARLCAIAEGRPAHMHSYPDLLRWTPPQSQLDGVGRANGTLALAGLGSLTPLADPINAKDACWQWTRIDFGATMLVKRRPDPRPLPPTNIPPRRDLSTPARNLHQDSAPSRQPDRTASPAEPERQRADAPVTSNSSQRSGEENSAVTALATGPRPPATATPTVDQILEWVQRQNYSDYSIAYAMKRLSDVGTIEQLIAFAVALRGRFVGTPDQQ